MSWILQKDGPSGLLYWTGPQPDHLEPKSWTPELGQALRLFHSERAVELVLRLGRHVSLQTYGGAKRAIERARVEARLEGQNPTWVYGNSAAAVRRAEYRFDHRVRA